MITGYTKPLYFLPFDHRGSYITGFFKWKEPLNVEQTVSVPAASTLCCRPPGADPVAECRHAIQHRVNLGDDVFPINKN